MEKSCRKCAQKLVPDPFLILVNNPKQPLHARNSFKNKYFERLLSKSLKKVNSIFSFKPGHLQWTKLSKTKGARISDHSLSRLQNKFRKIPLLVTYYLTNFDDII